MILGDPLSIPEENLARNMDIGKAMRLAFRESMSGLREAYTDLTDEQFQRYVLPSRNNILSLVMHCLTQVDDYNGYLQWRRGASGPLRDWHFLPVYERFDLWEMDGRIPSPTEDMLLPVSDVLTMHDTVEAAVLASFETLTEEDVLAPTEGPCPRLCDWWFRVAYHQHAHVRQIWLMRGLLGVTTRWPEQRFA